MSRSHRSPTDSSGPSRRAFLVLGATPLLGALLPRTASAVLGPPEARLGYLQGSQSWTQETPAYTALMQDGALNPSTLIPAAHLTPITPHPEAVRLTVRPLHQPYSVLQGLDEASMELVAFPHRVPFRVFSYRRTSVDPMTLPTHMTVPVDPKRGFEMLMRSRWRGDTADVVTRMTLGAREIPVQRGAYVVSVQTPAELLALALWLDT
ncbi:MAG: hypothetical protein AAFS10_03350 [Myxococcota bacterium]